MQCPNCGERIDDRAVACNHCGRDLTSIKPVALRLDALDIQEVELRGDPTAKPASPTSTPHETPHLVGTDRETQAKQKPAGGFKNKMAGVWSEISATLYIAVGSVGIGFILHYFYPYLDIKSYLTLGAIITFVFFVIFIIVSSKFSHHDK